MHLRPGVLSFTVLWLVNPALEILTWTPCYHQTSWACSQQGSLWARLLDVAFGNRNLGWRCWTPC